MSPLPLDLPASARVAAFLGQGEGPGHRARKRFGQHFLLADGLIDRIVAGAGIGPESRVLEVGPGPGVLTAALLRTGAAVLAVEIDRDCVAFLEDSLPLAPQACPGRLQLVEGDATAVDLAALLPGPGWVCVSNLPYNVGTRILLRLLEGPPRLDRLVVMLQHEVALRLLAPPGDRRRGSLSVAVQARAELRRLLRVPPGAFQPPPKVDSAVIELLPRQEEIPALDPLLRAAFAAPRKTLRNNLRAAYGPAGEEAILRAGLAPSARPAELDLAQWRALDMALRGA